MPGYIPPAAKANKELTELQNNISSLQQKHQESFYLFPGGFNHVTLTETLSKFHQHVNIPTWGTTQWTVFTSTKETRTQPSPTPYPGFSNYISVMLVPAYHHLVRCQHRGPSPCGPVTLCIHCRAVSSAQTGRSSGRQPSMRERWSWRITHQLSSAKCLKSALRLNNSGPRTDPWGTPQAMSFSWDAKSPLDTKDCPSCK